jgi:hypothetical protein
MIARGTDRIQSAFCGAGRGTTTTTTTFVRPTATTTIPTTGTSTTVFDAPVQLWSPESGYLRIAGASRESPGRFPVWR